MEIKWCMTEKEEHKYIGVKKGMKKKQFEFFILWKIDGKTKTANFLKKFKFYIILYNRIF